VLDLNFEGELKGFKELKVTDVLVVHVIYVFDVLLIVVVFLLGS
jgi:hypothetical protein